MNRYLKIHKIEYVDAFYVSKNILSGIKLYPHIAYGRVLRECPSHIVLEFICDSNKKVPFGLIIPTGALPNNKCNKKFYDSSYLNKKVGVTWADIVHFDGIVPASPSTMYTEGLLIETSEKYIIIKKPTTLRLLPLPIRNHPADDPFYYIIPMGLIAGIDVYE